MSRSSVDRMDMFWFEVGFLFSEFPWLQNDVKAMEKCHNFFHITFYDGTRVGAQRADRSSGYKWLEEVGGPRDGTGLYNKLTAGKSNDLDLFPFKIGDDNCYNLNSTKNDPKYISYCKSFVRKSLFGWRPKLFSHFLIQKPALDDNAGTWRFNN